MKILSLLFLITVSFFTSNAQDIRPQKQLYTTVVKLKHLPMASLKGTLYDVKDSSFLVSQSVFNKNTSANDLHLVEVYAFDTEKIKISRKNKVLRGLGYGALTGLAIGAIVGLASGTDPADSYFSMTAGQKALGFGILGATVGGLTGTIYGLSVSVNIPINGNLDNFIKSKETLKRYSLKMR